MSQFLKLTSSQREIVDLTTQPIRGVQTNIVKVETGNAGVSYAARMAEQASRAADDTPRVLRLCATSHWDAVMSLIKLGGKGCYGSGNLDTIERCIRALSGESKRPLCFLLDRAGRMKTQHQEDFLMRCEWAANLNKVAIRVIYFFNKSKFYHIEEHKFVKDFHVASNLLKKAEEVYTFSATGLEELIGSDREAPANELEKRKLA